MNKKMLVAMSHKLTDKQIADFDGEVVISNKYTNLNCSRISPNASNAEIKEMAKAIVNEAILCNCTHIGANGEPALTFHIWREAIELNLIVVQSTTERVSSEITLPDGTIKKISNFNHVQWREIR